MQGSRGGARRRPLDSGEARGAPKSSRARPVAQARQRAPRSCSRPPPPARPPPSRPTRSPSTIGSAGSSTSSWCPRTSTFCTPRRRTLPFACRHGCCTSCAVRIKSGQIRQPEALGISADLREQGYALLCVGYPSSDLEVETQDEDEVYWLQFGRYFARGPVDRDDYALELAMGDE